MSTEYREIVEDLTNHGEEDLEQTDPLNVTYMLEDFDDLQKKKVVRDLISLYSIS